MKNLIILGASGYGRDIHSLAKECNGFESTYIIKGFLDDNKNALDGFNNYPPVIDTLKNYVVKKDDVFVCAIGDIKAKKKCVNIIVEKGGEFLTLIHPLAHIDFSATVGVGCVIQKNAFLGSCSAIGDFVQVQDAAIIGHDVKIGDYSRIDCFVVCVGGVIIENGVTIHTSAVINNKVSIGRGATVGALSFVIRKVKEDAIVFGNPAININK